MTVIARVIFQALPAAAAEFEILKVLAIFCGIGLLASLLVASYGIDLSPGFF